MKALVDLERMVFLYVHDSASVLSRMVWLENHGSPTTIIPLDHPSNFEGFTDLELRLLYKHTTGVDHSGFSRGAWLQLVYETALRLPKLRVNVAELEAQSDYVGDDDIDQYRYLPGSKAPKLVEGGLFSVPSLATKPDTLHEQILLTGTLANYPPLAALPGTGRATPGAGTNTPVRARTTASGPPRGGLRDVIWSKADEMWNEAGKPTDTKVVLSLRKRIMDVLEQDGVKRTSSSNELGNWAKVRISNPT